MWLCFCRPAVVRRVLFFPPSLAATLWRGPPVCSAAERAAVGRRGSFRLQTTAGGTNSRFARSCVRVLFFFSAFAGSPCTVTPVLLRQNDDLNLEATPPRAPGEDFTTGVVCQCRTTDFNCSVPALRCQQNLALRPCLIIGAPSAAGRPSVPAREAQSVARRLLGSSVI